MRAVWTNMDEITPKEAINKVEESDATGDDELIIECTKPQGTTIHCAKALEVGDSDDIWVANIETKGDDLSTTTSRTSVKRILERCEPDIDVITRAESRFPDHEDDPAVKQ